SNPLGTNDPSRRECETQHMRRDDSIYMNYLWYLVAAATLAAAHNTWQRRHLWNTGHATPTHAALSLGVGLTLISPLGEPAGTLTHNWTGLHNLEDVAGHLFILAAAALY